MHAAGVGNGASDSSWQLSALRILQLVGCCVLFRWLWLLAMRGCKSMLGLKPRAPDWMVYARLFPRGFPRAVGFLWEGIHLLPCETLIWLFQLANPWSREDARPRAVWHYRRLPGCAGKVALTIDDAPALPGKRPLMQEVLDLLDEFDASCTFFVVSSFIEGREDLLRSAVERGHELGNHGGRDVPYHTHSKEDFRKVYLDCETMINECLAHVNENAGPPAPRRAVNRRNNKWFRPPWARMSQQMSQVLEREGARLAMSDCHGLDVMCRPPFIANYTARHAMPGSMVLLHMPSVGFREYNLESIRSSLAGLKARGLKCVSLSELEASCSAAAVAQAKDAPRKTHD